MHQMQYYTRQLYVNDAEANDDVEKGYAREDWDVADKSYAERLLEIKSQLPPSVNKLFDDAAWMDTDVPESFVDDHFAIPLATELIFLVQKGDVMFVLRYSVEEQPVVEPPAPEEEHHFKTDNLLILQEEWDIDNGDIVHRLLLSNGFSVGIKVKEFKWWKVEVKASA